MHKTMVPFPEAETAGPTAFQGINPMIGARVSLCTEALDTMSIM